MAFEILYSYFADEKIVKKNIKLMQSRKRGGFIQLVLTESMGGNAGAYGKFPNIGANFFFDPNTGEIIAFGNIQEMSPEVREKYLGGFFIVALLLKDRVKDTKYYIHEVGFKGKASFKARVTIKEMVREYNLAYGFDPKVEEPY